MPSQSHGIIDAIADTNRAGIEEASVYLSRLFELTADTLPQSTQDKTARVSQFSDSQLMCSMGTISIRDDISYHPSVKQDGGVGVQVQNHRD